MHESGIPFEADGLMEKYKAKTQHHINFNMQSERDMSMFLRNSRSPAPKRP